MEEQSMLLDVLQIIVPAFLIVGGGAFAYWKYLQERNRLSSAASQSDNQQWADYKLKAEQAAWERVKHTIDMQAKRIDEQDKRIEELEREFKKATKCISVLEEKFGECERNVELLEKKNEILESENYKLKEK